MTLNHVIQESCECTSESQGHGKAWSVDIQEKVYGISSEL